MSDTDHELMRRCADDDWEAFEALILRWQGRVGRVAARLAASPADVDDVAQEVFLRVLAARQRYRPVGAFSTWLYRIVLNTARDAGRKQRRKPAALGDHEPVCQSDPPQRTVDRRELGEKVETALSALPSRLREVLVLKHYGELTFQELAEVTGEPASTLKSRLQVAHRQLRGELARAGINGQELEP